MKLSVYVILDNVSMQNSPLFLCPSDDRAKLQFKEFLKEIPFSADNYDLYKVGTYDSDEIKLATMSKCHVANGLAFVQDQVAQSTAERDATPPASTVGE